VTEKKTTKLNFGVNGDIYYQNAERIMEEIRELRDTIVHAEGARTVANTVDPLSQIDILLDATLNDSELMESVHPDKGMRDAAEVVRQELAKVASELELDRELYDAVVAIESTVESPSRVLKRFIAHTLRDFRRAGVDRDEPTRQRISKLNEELVLLSQAFNRNIRNDTRSIEITGPRELDGLPEDYIAGHPPDENGVIRITTDYPDFTPFASYAKSRDHRRRLFFEYMNRAFPANESVLKEILQKRHELANLLGHDSYAAYAASDKMIGSREAILRFINRIADIARDRSARDYQTLLKRKQRDFPDAEHVEDFEKTFYSEQVRAEEMNFDSQEVRPYLEYARVKEGVLTVTSELFDLEYRAVDEPAWHPSVETFDVYSKGDRIGRFYLDMHPRESKYKHAAMFPIVSGVAGGRLPKAALVCNFQAPTPSSPALLEHSDVVTLFHEFGHLLHHILGGRQPYVRFSGVATEWDFVEVPSQLLEEWASSYETLKRFAVHCETGEAIPKEMVDRMNKARSFGRGSRVSQQMFYAALSYTYHASDPSDIDLTGVLKETQSCYSPYPHMKGTHLQTSFGHLEGYSALYYTYMWSLVIARDLFEQFAQKGLFNTDLAVHYADTVLRPGGTKDAAQLIRDFFGRDYSLDAFEKWVNE
jgi:thimet oligopeptidase